MAKGEVKNDWVLESAVTNCDISRSYMKDGGLYSEEETFKGTPENCKKWIAPKHVGEKVVVNHVHTKKTYSRVEHTITNQGTTKKRVELVKQEDSFMDDDMDDRYINNSKPQFASTEYSEKPQQSQDPEAGLTHKTATLKNMIDNILADNRFQWIAIVGLAVAIVVCVTILSIK